MPPTVRRRFILSVLAASGAALLPLSGLADEGKGKGRGKSHKKHHSDSRDGNRNNGEWDNGDWDNGNWNGRDYAEARGCPPGLAKKNPPCVPPGQARKRRYEDDREWWDRDWERGDYIGDYDYHRVRYPDRYGLRRLPPGQNYMILGNRVVVVDSNTYRIMAVMNAVTSLLD